MKISQQNSFFMHSAFMPGRSAQVRKVKHFAQNYDMNKSTQKKFNPGRRRLLVIPVLALGSSLACATRNVSGYLQPINTLLTKPHPQNVGLDWHYCDTQTVSGDCDRRWVHFRGSIEIDHFFPVLNSGPESRTCLYSVGSSHLVFSVNCTGTATHLTPSTRNGRALFSQARGFIIGCGENEVYGEHWHGYDPQGNPYATVQHLTTPAMLASKQTPVHELRTWQHKRLWFDIKAGHRAGALAGTMSLELRSQGPDGRLLFRSNLPLGWDCSGSSYVRCAIGYIGPAEFFPRGYFDMRATLEI